MEWIYFSSFVTTQSHKQLLSSSFSFPQHIYSSKHKVFWSISTKKVCWGELKLAKVYTYQQTHDNKTITIFCGLNSLVYIVITPWDCKENTKTIIWDQPPPPPFPIRQSHMNVFMCLPFIFMTAFSVLQEERELWTQSQLQSQSVSIC